MEEIFQELIILIVEILLILFAVYAGDASAIRDASNKDRSRPGTILSALGICLLVAVFSCPGVYAGTDGSKVNILIFLITFIPFLFSYYFITRNYYRSLTKYN